MRLAERPSRFGAHRNAFGFLRLLFASLVIVSHVPEIVDGDTRRELLHRLTGTTTFGEVAVYGFFVISGYLITGSWLSDPSLRDYILKRALRIYPGFIAASLLCLLVVAPLSGGAYGSLPRTAGIALLDMAVLARPWVLHPFDGRLFGDSPGLDGPMWTIQYEFGCYLLVIVLAALGFLRRGWPVPVLAAALLGIGTLLPGSLPAFLSHGRFLSGRPDQLFLLPGMFLAGSAFFLHRHRIAFGRARVAAAAVLFAGCLFTGLAPIGYAAFGSYLIFAAARAGAGTRLAAVNDRIDISYGVYLYAWPVEGLILRYLGSDHLVLVGVLTWAGAALLGRASWTLVERPALRWARARTARPGDKPRTVALAN